MNKLDHTIEVLRSLRAEVGYGTFDQALRILHRERLNAGTVIRRKKLTFNQKMKLYAKQDGRCARCHEVFPIKELTDDHIVPISRGGGNDFINRRLVCRSCNSSKGDRDLIEDSKRTGETALEQLTGDNVANNK